MTCLVYKAVRGKSGFLKLTLWCLIFIVPSYLWSYHHAPLVHLCSISYLLSRLRLCSVPLFFSNISPTTLLYSTPSCCLGESQAEACECVRAFLPRAILHLDSSHRGTCVSTYVRTLLIWYQLLYHTWLYCTVLLSDNKSAPYLNQLHCVSTGWLAQLSSYVCLIQSDVF